jgi:hypothetical protein
MIPFLVAVLFSAALAPAQAADPYVVYTANWATNGAVVLRTDPAIGSLVEISRNGAQGNLFVHPFDLAVERDGNLVIADMGELNVEDGSVIRVDPFTGRQRLLSSGGLFDDPAGITVAPNGDLYVVDNQIGTSSGAVIKVDPVSGEQTLIASNLGPIGGLFDFSFGITAAPDGSLIVVNRAAGGSIELLCPIEIGSVFRVTPGVGVEWLTDPLLPLNLSLPIGVTVDTDGNPVVVNECPGHSLVKIGPGGAQTPIGFNGSDDLLVTPERVAMTPAGDYLVSDFSLGADADGGIVRIARGNQAQSLVSAGPLFNNPIGIATVPNRPPTPVLSATPGTVAAGQQVGLDASGSRDPEGLRLVYEWDLNGDGGFEAASGTTPSAAPRFASDGVKTVRVRVNDPHGGRAVAETALRVDGSVPVITGLRVGRVLGLRSKPRRRASGAAPPRSTQLRFRLSEVARVTVTLDRARAGRRLQGRACNPRAKRGRRCTIYSRARTIRRTGVAGQNAIVLRARGLKPGTYRITVRAVDAVGNSSSPRRLRMRVVRE